MTGRVLIWIVVVGATLFLFSRFMPPANAPEAVRYSHFLDEVADGQVDSVVLQGEQIIGTRKDKTQFQSFNPESDNSALIGELRRSKVAFEGRAPKEPSLLTQFLIQLSPALLLILVFVYMLRQMQGARVPPSG